MRHLRERPAHAEVRRRAAPAEPGAGSRAAARPDASDPVRAGVRHRDGSRVLLRGRRARTRREQPHTGPSRRQHARRVRRRRHPRRRILEPLPGRLRRAAGAQRAVGDPRPRRCAALAGGDDRTPRGRRPRREQESDHRTGRGDRARAGPGRAGMCRRAQDAWHRAGDRRRLLVTAAEPRRAPRVRRRGRPPRRARASMSGGASTVSARW